MQGKFALAAPALALGVSLASPASAQGVRLEPSDGNLAVVVFGSMDGVEPEAFANAVVAAIPDELLDRQRNFTQHPAYLPERDYALVLAFHDPAQPVETDLCRSGADGPEGLPPRPDFRGLDNGVGLTGALCMDGQTLRTASGRSAGRVVPGQASFRFLIADAAKALFPDGFERLPRAAAGAP